eukprot:CAMPEP_0172596294 /NCGR_PEP_ID=MMETSP1068-20121228/16067_1 /TAXON_ID=35684 /ORGANISM="Pseudopedinella elastica, Strain CCMP716" /LENGTH=129 /DNA_ID=CAMNT_0013395253 /DNA_START=385 /DNA_END=772 /DNA_ORIENTATION=-
MDLEIPGYYEGPDIKYRGILRRDEPSFREAKAEPARVMELELSHRFRMRARNLGFAGFKDDASVNEFGEHQAKLRVNRRGVALPGWSLSCVQLRGPELLRGLCLASGTTEMSQAKVKPPRYGASGMKRA